MVLSRHIALYTPTLSGGGAERCMLSLARRFAEMGYRVDLVVNRKRGAYATQTGDGIRLVELKRYRRRWRLRGRLMAVQSQPSAFPAMALPVVLARKPIMDLNYLPALARYLRSTRPAGLVSALTQANLLSIWARAIAGTATRVVISEHTTISRRIKEEPSEHRQWRWRFLPGLLSQCYPAADAIVAVSRGVAEDLAATTGLEPAAIRTIYNPVVSAELYGKAREPLDHAWFTPGAPPVVMGIGKLVPGKDFQTLLRAFACLRKDSDARLMVLGEGQLRQQLLTFAATLGIESDIAFPGWVDNPYKYLARAGVFVSSSRYEGFSMVLAEAMACGCPVVSTDCPSGPREILDNGRHGALVPVGDVEALTGAMVQALERPASPESLRRRAASFSVQASAELYLDALFPMDRQWRPARMRAASG